MIHAPAVILKMSSFSIHCLETLLFLLSKCTKDRSSMSEPIDLSSFMAAPYPIAWIPHNLSAILLFVKFQVVFLYLYYSTKHLHPLSFYRVTLAFIGISLLVIGTTLVGQLPDSRWHVSFHSRKQDCPFLSYSHKENIWWIPMYSIKSMASTHLLTSCLLYTVKHTFT